MEIRRIENGFIVTEERREKAYKTIEELLQAVYNRYGPLGAYRHKVVILEKEEKGDQ